jgi:hypothetical protein
MKNVCGLVLSKDSRILKCVNAVIKTIQNLGSPLDKANKEM